MTTTNDCSGSQDGIRNRFLTVAVQLGLALLGITEGLSLFGALTRPWVAVCWVIALAAVVRGRLSFKAFRFDWFVAFCCVAIGGIVTLTGVTAWFSPPNSSDAMAYHMPRVIYWAEQAGVRFFPTPYLNQIMLQPLAEYAMLHLYLLAGSDGLTNFVQWGAALASIVGVSAIAREFGADSRGQAIAALFAATLPAGILAASGAKNDWVLALWIVCSVYFAMRENTVLLGIAIGCALLTKGTAYLFLPPLLVALLYRAPRKLALAGLIAAAMNAPHYARNYDLSGSILGFDSAQGDGQFRWRNDMFGWKQTASNVLRNVSEQLGARSEQWNQGVFDTVVAAHRAIGADPNDPATTWPGERYAAPTNANHEANAPNRWHVLALLILVCTANRRTAPYAIALVVGFLAFSFYLKWQPFMARLELPLLVAAAPLAGRNFRAPVALVLCVFFISGVRLPALQNWVRPLQGPKSVLSVPRDEQYFADLQAWKNQASYEQSAELLVSSRCRRFGLDINNLQIEYPLIALVRERAPDSEFVHVGTQNASAKYRQPVEGKVCAVVCLDCLGDPRRTSPYAAFGDSVAIGRFLVYRQ